MKLKKLSLIAALGVVLSLVALSATSHAADKAKYLLVSDIDDTIKITNVLDKDEALKNGLFGHRVFLGMSELYQELAHSSGFVYMSGSPPFLEHSLQDMLIKEHHFPDGRFELRDWITEDIYKFKTAGFAELAKTCDLPFIALGDDTERDFDVLSEFRKMHGEQKLVGAYIHRVTGRQIPSNVTPYHVAYEVALAELEAGRLTADQALRVGNAMLKANKPEEAIPSFAECPEDLEIVLGPKAKANDKLVSLAAQLELQLVRYCYKRHGDEFVEPNPPKLSPVEAEIFKRERERMRQRTIRDVEENLP
jgi:hypothetical protein